MLFDFFVPGKTIIFDNWHSKFTLICENLFCHICDIVRDKFHTCKWPSRIFLKNQHRHPMSLKKQVLFNVIFSLFFFGILIVLMFLDSESMPRQSIYFCLKPFTIMAQDLIKHMQNILIKFLGCRDPRWKHEYLDSGQSWLMTDEKEVNESDKHI